MQIWKHHGHSKIHGGINNGEEHKVLQGDDMEQRSKVFNESVGVFDSCANSQSLDSLQETEGILMEWKEVKNETDGEKRKVHNFNESPIFEGVLVNRVDSFYGGHDYVFDTKAEKNILVYGKKVLQGKLEKVEIGSLVRIYHLGKIKGTNQTYENFKVTVAIDNSIPEEAHP